MEKKWAAALIFLAVLFIIASVIAYVNNMFTMFGIMLWYWGLMLLIGPGFFLGLINGKDEEK